MSPFMQFASQWFSWLRWCDSRESGGDGCDCGLDEVYQIGWGDLELEAAHTSTYIYGLKIRCGAVEISREVFLGISGVHSDDREVKKAATEGNKRAKLARDMQWYQIRKVIGSYIAAMNGVDVIAFTGGIGENCTDLREDVLTNLSYLGIKLDKAVNDATHGDEVELTLPGCPVRAFVVPTNEELAIARDTKALVE